VLQEHLPVRRLALANMLGVIQLEGAPQVLLEPWQGQRDRRQTQAAKMIQQGRVDGIHSSEFRVLSSEFRTLSLTQNSERRTMFGVRRQEPRRGRWAEDRVPGPAAAGRPDPVASPCATRTSPSSGWHAAS